MKHLRLSLLASLIAFSIALIPVSALFAHPLGNFTINRYSRITLSKDHLSLRYVVDMAEIPTYQEMANIDRNRDGKVDDGERVAYLQSKLAQLRKGLNLQISGRPVELNPITQDLSFPEGQGGLSTLRLVADFAATR